VNRYLEDNLEWYEYDIRNWCKEQNLYWLRIPLVLLGLHACYRILFQLNEFNLLGTLIFLTHELGHFVFMFFGRFLHVAGGSILQLLVPAIYIVQFFKKRNYFASSFCFFWLGESFYHLSFYVSDARERAMPLLSPFRGVILDGSGHDWFYLLNETGLLQWDHFFGEACRWIGFLCVSFFIVSSLWMIKIMRESDST